MASLQQQARALGDPTRHAVFRYVMDASGHVSVAELTDHFGLNHNAIRQHLAKLVDAGLVTETTDSPAGPGRPRLLYSVGPHAESHWGPVGPYERLSLMLSEMVRTGDTPVKVGRRVGRRYRPETDADPVALLTDQMARHGFDPAVKISDSRVEVTLRSCPFATTAVADPETICELHLGIAEGIADRLGSIVVDELIRRDPRQANCVLRCRTTPHQGG